MTSATATAPAKFFRPYELRNRRSFVVGEDFVRHNADGTHEQLVEKLAQANAAELRQRGVDAELSPTALTILCVLRVVRGIKGGVHGCGAQLSVDEWCRITGRCERMVQYALAVLERDGLIFRVGETRSVAAVTAHRAPENRATVWIDAKGREHEHIDCVSITYLTEAGAELVDRFGKTRALVTVKGSSGVAERRSVATGLLWRLWKTLRDSMGAAARRLRRSEIDCTPSVLRTDSEKTRRLDTYEVPRSRRTAQGEELRPAGARGVQGRSSTAEHDSRAATADLRSNPSAALLTAKPLSGAGASGLLGGRAETVAVPDRRSQAKRSAFETEIERCWSNRATVTRYRQPQKWFAGGDALVPNGAREEWSPILTAARWKPEFWRNASQSERGWLEQKFAPLRRELLSRLEAQAGELRARELELEDMRRAAELEGRKRREQMLEQVAVLEAMKRAKGAAWT